MKMAQKFRVAEEIPPAKFGRLCIHVTDSVVLSPT